MTHLLRKSFLIDALQRGTPKMVLGAILRLNMQKNPTMYIFLHSSQQDRQNDIQHATILEKKWFHPKIPARGKPCKIMSFGWNHFLSSNVTKLGYIVYFYVLNMNLASKNSFGNTFPSYLPKTYYFSCLSQFAPIH